MTCPNCEIKLECPCRSCQKHRKKDGEIAALLWEWVDGNTMMCPVCGFSHHADFWMDWELYEYDRDIGSGDDSGFYQKYYLEHLKQSLEEYRQSEERKNLKTNVAIYLYAQKKWEHWI